MVSRHLFTKKELDDYYDNLKKENLGALWKDLGHMVTKEPVHDVKPYLWKWKTVREFALKSGQLLEPGKDAERRVVYLQNPSLIEKGLIGFGTHTLYAGIQLLLPGEYAPSHRHSQAAIRFIIEGEGAYTAVNGEKTYMERGDMILTPAWTWHEHKHEGTEPVFWMDGLDVGLVKSLAASYFEQFKAESYPELPAEEYAAEKYKGGAYKKLNEVMKPGSPSPVYGYKLDRVKYVLNQMTEEDNDPYEAYAIEYINPSTGGSADGRIGTVMQRLVPGQHTKAHRHVHSAIFHVFEGTGYTIIDGQKFEWEQGDFFILPPWSYHEHVNTGEEDAFLFSYNDKPVLEKLDLEFGNPYQENNGQQVITSIFKAETTEE